MPNTRSNKKNLTVDNKEGESSKEVKVVVELKIPQTTPNSNMSTLLKTGITRFIESEHGGKDAKASITPVKDIHIVEFEINTVKLAEDKDVQANQTFNAIGKVSPTRPISIFINITGEANTMISFNVEIAGNNEFKGDLFIPNSGRLVIQKIIP